MVCHRKFSARIEVEGKPLPEYLVTIDANTNKVECWVPSEGGKTFSVHWVDHGTQAYSCGFIYLDGVVHPGRFLNGVGATSREGVRTGPNFERPFVFADQTAGTSNRAAPNCDTGTIMLKIRLVDIQGARTANPIQPLRDPPGSRNNRLGNYISYGKEKRAHRQYHSTWNVVPYDKTGNRSHVTFVFRYRPIDLLYSHGIVPGEEALQITPGPQKSEK